MSAVLTWLSGKGTALAIGAAIPLVLMFAKKLIPARVGGILGELIGRQFQSIDKIEDPVLKGIVLSIALDLVRLAEYELPDPGTGDEKYKKVAAKLCMIIPILKGQEEKIEDIIEQSVAAMDKELKKQIPG